jgi:glyoxylase-like metal-dependent hydrolase (beta-lactamase superfamily II)/rhodanese-related sulfurtransferase
VIFTQYYLDCLSQASYLIGDETTGRAAVVDPRRDVGEYLADAATAGLRIELVVETHFHADFVSGHLELARETGAEIAYGEAADPDFPHRKLADGERVSLGRPGVGGVPRGVALDVLATPGHTPESISLVVWEDVDDEAPYGVLTGDTLFIGDVGRPDLLSAAGLSSSDLARRLYRSLHDKLLRLPDVTRVYPAHGAGSACGKNLSSATVSTIGEQRVGNYALALPDEDAFVAAVTADQPAAPAYFPYDAARNKEDRPLLDESPPLPLAMDEVLRLQAAGATVLDTREPADFAAGHVAGSINVGLGGRYAEYAGSVLDPDTDVVLVSDPGHETEAKTRLARIGYDRVVGYLARPVAALVAAPGAARQASRLDVDQLAAACDEIDPALVDVRNPGEVAQGTIPGAVTIPLSQLRARLGELDPERATVVYCASGFRSSIGASLLRAAGFDDVSDLKGGYNAWSARYPDGFSKPASTSTRVRTPKPVPPLTA